LYHTQIEERERKREGNKERGREREREEDRLAYLPKERNGSGLK